MQPVEDLESFLSEVEAQLRDLPQERRQEILYETRAHLEALIASNRADGLPLEAAWQKAQDVFGDAPQIGVALAQEWQRLPRV